MKLTSKNSLILGRAIFTMIVIVALGLIVMNEKGGAIFTPKIKSKMQKYIDKNYDSIKEKLATSKVEYEDGKFKMKLTSTKNKNYYFYILYTNKKITDTYKKDYIEGKSILSYTEKQLSKKIKEKTNITTQVNIIQTLDKFSEKIQDRIIKQENLLQLKFYTLKTSMEIEEWTKEGISNEITTLLSTMAKNEITPKNYTIEITSKKDITKSIEISNITEEFKTNENKEEIIEHIITDNNSELLKENKIEYKNQN